MNQKQLEQAIRNEISRLKNLLEDSPVSLRANTAERMGFYKGYCAAKNWHGTFDFIKEMEYFVP